MHDHGSHKEEEPKGIPRLALIGNPNVGKSVIFGYLTGKYVTVSNYPGTTVEITSARASVNKKEYVVIDTLASTPCCRCLRMKGSQGTFF